MADFIEFVALESNHAAGGGTLPALHGKGFQAALSYGGGMLPALSSSGRQFAHGGGTLPALHSKGFQAALSFGGGTLPALRSFGVGAMPVNDASYGTGILPALHSKGAAHAEAHASTPTGGATLPALTAVGYAGFAGKGYSTANNRLPGLSSQGQQYLTPLSWVSVLQSPGFMRVVTGDLYWQDSSRDGLAIADTAFTTLVRPYRDRVGVGAVSAGLLDALDAVDETFAFEDVANYLWQWLAADVLGLAGSSTTTGTYLVELADALALVAGAANLLDAQDAVVEALALGATQAFVWPSSMTEALGFADAQVTLIEAWHKLVDGLRLAGTQALSIEFGMLVRESVALGDDSAVLAEMLDVVREGVALLVSVAVDDGVYVGWVFHAGPNAYTSYTNVPFNSVATMPDGRTYAALPDGIYRLEGDDDAGEPIEARIRSGLEAFGTQRMKRLPMMYVGYRTTGDMVLKVVSTSMEGEAREDWYRLERRPADAVRESRVKIGRGLKSAYFGFELVNVDGADFELDSIEFFPVVLERRVN